MMATDGLSFTGAICRLKGGEIAGVLRNPFRGSFLCVQITTLRAQDLTAVVLDTKMTSSLAKRFKIDELPTLVVISPKGEQYKDNLTGFVGPAALKELLADNAPQE